MTNYEKREEKAILNIAKTLDKLNTTLDTIGSMDVENHKIKAFFEQEKAIHEIKKIIRNEKKLEDIDEAQLQDVIDAIEKSDANMADTINQIEKEIDKLETTLGKLQDTDSKVISYVEQKKALHEIKKLLNLLGVDEVVITKQ